MWKRKIEVIQGQRIWNNDDIHISFIVPFSSDEEADVIELQLYNISDTSISYFKKGNNVVINAGYEGDVGTIFTGQVTYFEKRIDGSDFYLFVELVTSNNWLTQPINKTFPSGIKASQVINNVIGDLGVSLGDLELVNDIVYKNGLTLTGTVKNALTNVVKDTQSQMYLKNNVLTIVPTKKGQTIGFVLNSASGLIESPELAEIDDATGYKVKCLLQHRINVDSVIRVESKKVNGLFRVVRGEHREDFTTELEVVAYD